MSYDTTMKLLGMEVRDKVTNFQGHVTSVCFDLYGCEQALVSPEVDENGKHVECRWFDASRLKVFMGEPVLPVPDFGVPAQPTAKLAKAYGDTTKGPAEKPIPDNA